MKTCVISVTLGFPLCFLFERVTKFDLKKSGRSQMSHTCAYPLTVIPGRAVNSLCISLKKNDKIDIFPPKNEALEGPTTVWIWQFTPVSRQLKLSAPFSFLVISQESSFITEIYSVFAKRHFNFVKKNHAWDSRVCFDHYCFWSVHTLGFMVRCGFAKKENYSKKLCWKHIHFCWRNGKNTENSAR